MYEITITNSYIIVENIIKNTHEYYGALFSFTGTIKFENNNKQVKSVRYRVFKQLFIQLLKKRCESLIKNNHIDYISITQFTGTLHVGGINSIILVSAKNRNTAFYACKDLVEMLKYELPVWKKETYLDGTYQWINV
ncbi:MAG: molybdenum cofactor biosynthesis protein MoaE [Candidatus Riesia sp.]|nr:molybdenum cofactor biosynthesis protein MoaE [Candidatus Riesia sp.]